MRRWLLLIALNASLLSPGQAIAQPTAAELRRSLKDRDGQVRVRAAVALARLAPDDPRAVPVLLDALKDTDAEVRLAAVTALAELAPPGEATLATLLRVLKDDTIGRVRAGAARALGRISAPGKDIGKAQAQVITALSKTVRDDRYPFVCEACMMALRNFGPDAKEVIPFALVRLKADRSDAGAALDLLWRMGPVSVPALCEALKGSQRGWRYAIIELLEDMGPAAKEAVPVLLQSLKSDDVPERVAAVVALTSIAWKSEAPRITEALRQLIQETEWNATVENLVRKYFETLGPGDEVALPALLAWLKDDPGQDRKAALLIASIGPSARAAVPALRSKVDAKLGAEPEFAYALWRLGYKGEALTALRKHWETAERIDPENRDLLILAEIGPDAVEMVPLLKQALREEPRGRRALDRQMRMALALWRIQKPIQVGALVLDPRQDALDVMLDRLRTNDLAAMHAIGEIGPEARSAVPILIKAAKDDSDEIRLVAVHTLGLVGGGSQTALDALQTALKDNTRDVRIQALIALTHINRHSPPLNAIADLLKQDPGLLRQFRGALSELGGDAKPIVPTLLRLLRDDDGGVHLIACRLLRKIDPAAADKAGVP